MPRTAIRARLVDFSGNPSFAAAAVREIDDGLLLIEDGRIVARGEYGALSRAFDLREGLIDHSGCIVMPGFIDAHTHLPQIDVIAASAGGLLDWLTRHTYPAEARFADAEVADEAASFFLDELARHGTTSACVLGSVHARSVEALFAEAHARGLRLVAGKCLMDRNCPESLREPPERAVHEALALAARWHGTGRLSYAITPRFAAATTPRLLQLAGELARARPDLYVQTHLAESQEELRWVAELFPQSRSYLDVYDQVGLCRELSIYAHCIWLDDADRRRMAKSRAIAAVCPTSNLFLGSGVFDFAAALDAGMTLALGTDIGSGQSFSMLATMRAAHDVARLKGKALRALQLYFWATAGAADGLGWSGKVGTLEPGAEADLVVLDPAATPLLARRTANLQALEPLLFAIMVLGDDRVVRETYIAGVASKQAHARPATRPQVAGDARTSELSRRFMGRMRGAPSERRKR